MELDRIIDGLEIKEEIQPVSFSFHCLIGEILHRDEPQVNTTQENEKELASTELIPFMP